VVKPAQHGARDDFSFAARRRGENLAGLYSLIATCEANGVNPVDYLADVSLRVQTHPASRIDELLPHHWTPLQREPTAWAGRRRNRTNEEDADGLGSAGTCGHSDAVRPRTSARERQAGDGPCARSSWSRAPASE
jgi:hypothetical protein